MTAMCNERGMIARQRWPLPSRRLPASGWITRGPRAYPRDRTRRTRPAYLLRITALLPISPASRGVDNPRATRAKNETGGFSRAIDWAADPQRSPIENVQIDHRGADVAMPEQLLHGPDVVAVFQQMRRERVTQRILTLPMNRLSRSFTIVTIPSTVNT